MALTKSKLDLSGEQTSLILELRCVIKNESDSLIMPIEFDFIAAKNVVDRT